MTEQQVEAKQEGRAMKEAAACIRERVFCRQLFVANLCPLDVALAIFAGPFSPTAHAAASTAISR